MKCLWLSRILPFPQTAGDRIYSLNLAKALVAAGAEVTFAGFGGEQEPEPISGIHWHLVPGGFRSPKSSLMSIMPNLAARHATPAYKAALIQFAAERWDAVIIDHMAMGWVAQYRHYFDASKPTFVYVSHNHEGTRTRIQTFGHGSSLSLWSYMTQICGRTAAVPMWGYLLQDHLKTRNFERKVVQSCDIVTTITDNDLEEFMMTSPPSRGLVLSPGYSGERSQARTITPETPRSILVMGSFRWWVKQLNLKLLLDHAAPLMAAAGIDLHVVGDTPDDFLAGMKATYPGVRFSGYVEDLSECYNNARLALVAEPIGGGFKMKLLDYIFNGVPVVVLESCVAGIPVPVRANMLISRSLERLALAAIGIVDDVDRLDRMQRNAYAESNGAFEWAINGKILFTQIKERVL